jgi:uncharacterized membrane protein
VVLQSRIIAHHGLDSTLARALGRDAKGWISQSLYLVAIPLAFVRPWISFGIYVCVALMWIVPDRRIESRHQHTG